MKGGFEFLLLCLLIGLSFEKKSKSRLRSKAVEISTKDRNEIIKEVERRIKFSLDELRMRIFLNERLNYNGDVKTNQKSLSEVPYYTRTFTTQNDYKLCTVNINIPFTGNIDPKTRSRIVLYLDDEPIYNTQLHSNAVWDLYQLTMLGYKSNLKAGTHTMKVFAAVDGGTLYMPHYNTNLIEHKMSPSLFGSILITGDN